MTQIGCISLWPSRSFEPVTEPLPRLTNPAARQQPSPAQAQPEEHNVCAAGGVCLIAVR